MYHRQIVGEGATMKILVFSFIFICLESTKSFLDHSYLCISYTYNLPCITPCIHSMLKAIPRHDPLCFLNFFMDTVSSASKTSRSRPLSVLAIVALLVLVVVVDMKRRAAEDQLAQLSLRLSQLAGGGTSADSAQNQEIAKQIVERVRKIYDIPTDTEPTVATIVDVEALQKQNDFYKKAKNGNYLIVTKDRAILFDADANKVIDVVPVQIQPTDAAASSQPGAKPTPKAPANPAR